MLCGKEMNNMQFHITDPKHFDRCIKEPIRNMIKILDNVGWGVYRIEGK